MTAASGADQPKKARVCGDCELGNHETCAVESPTFYCPCTHASGADQPTLRDPDEIRAALQPRLDESDAAWVMNAFIEPLLGGEMASNLADALDAHRSQPLRISCVPYLGCSCGWQYPVDPGQRLAAWRAHRVAALMPLIEADRERAKAEGGAEALEQAAHEDDVVMRPDFPGAALLRVVKVADLRDRAAALRGSP